MSIDETQHLGGEPILYRCACGHDVQVDKFKGGQCENCQRIVSPKVLANELAATMTITGSLANFEAKRVDEAEYDSSILVGQTYGHYEIVKPLGRGGSGYVYQALDTSLQRYVAVKVLKSELEPPRENDDRSDIDVLLQEAVAQARVAHPNIVTIYYVGKEKGVPFFAMELVDGQSLSERIKLGKIRFGEISKLAEDICQALRFSYRLDVIHGDIKPSNILLPKSGGAKLSDFGLARRVSEESKLAQGGTPNYLAPEILFGAVPSKQSDMYALGVTLFEMTFGRLPIQLSGTTITNWQECHNQQHVEFPTEWPDHLPTNWGDVLNKLLAHDPANRYDSYSDLSMDLKKLSPKSDVIASPLLRVIAAVIDWTTVILFILPFRALLGSSVLESHPIWKLLILSADIIPIIIYTTLIFFWRQSMGRKLMQLRVINRYGMIPKGRKMAFRSILRMSVPWLLAINVLLLYVATSWFQAVPVILGAAAVLFLFVNTATMLLTSNHQSIHDLIFETRVVIDSD